MRDACSMGSAWGRRGGTDGPFCRTWRAGAPRQLWARGGPCACASRRVSRAHLPRVARNCATPTAAEGTCSAARSHAHHRPRIARRQHLLARHCAPVGQRRAATLRPTTAWSPSMGAAAPITGVSFVVCCGTPVEAGAPSRPHGVSALPFAGSTRAPVVAGSTYLTSAALLRGAPSTHVDAIDGV